MFGKKPVKKITSLIDAYLKKQKKSRNPDSEILIDEARSLLKDLKKDPKISLEELKSIMDSTICHDMNSDFLGLIIDIDTVLDEFEGPSEKVNKLKINNTLTTLNLGGNDISDTGATHIGEALKENNTLTRLSLWSNDIGKLENKFSIINVQDEFISGSNPKASLQKNKKELTEEELKELCEDLEDCSGAKFEIIPNQQLKIIHNESTSPLTHKALITTITELFSRFAPNFSGNTFIIPWGNHFENQLRRFEKKFRNHRDRLQQPLLDNQFFETSEKEARKAAVIKFTTDEGASLNIQTFFNTAQKKLVQLLLGGYMLANPEIARANPTKGEKIGNIIRLAGENIPIPIADKVVGFVLKNVANKIEKNSDKKERARQQNIADLVELNDLKDFATDLSIRLVETYEAQINSIEPDSTIQKCQAIVFIAEGAIARIIKFLNNSGVVTDPINDLVRAVGKTEIEKDYKRFIKTPDGVRLRNVGGIFSQCGIYDKNTDNYYAHDTYVYEKLKKRRDSKDVPYTFTSQYGFRLGTRKEAEEAGMTPIKPMYKYVRRYA